VFDRLLNRLKFRLERMLLRGPQYRLLVIALAILGVSVFAGVLAYVIDPAFAKPGDAIWWAFLRLTDPGYIGDDQGTLKRVVSTIVTVAGYVLFLGALVAIMTQWLNRTLDRFEHGVTPVVQNNHVLILGWTNRTVDIVRELLEAGERLRRFLRRHRQRQLCVVILVENDPTELVQELRDKLGKLYDERRMIVRAGSPLRIEHLRRVDYANAAAIVIPGRDFAEDGAVQSDARVLKTLLAISAFAREGGERLPLLVAELFNAQKASLARHAYQGEAELIASRSFITRLMAECLRHPGLSRVHEAMLSRHGDAIVFVRDRNDLDGMKFGELREQYKRAIVLGVARPKDQGFVSFLHPSDRFVLEASDRVVLLARERGATETVEVASKKKREKSDDAPPDSVPTRSRVRRSRRVLVLGHSRKLPTLVDELVRYPGESFELTVVSRLSKEKRGRQLSELAKDSVTIIDVDADFTSSDELTALDPHGFDNVLVPASEWLGSTDATDTRTIVGCLVLDEILSHYDTRPPVLVELLDPANEPLVRPIADDVIVSPTLLSYQLAQISLRRELGVVFDELFSAGGAELLTRPASEYELEGEMPFQRVVKSARARREIVIGVQRGGPRGQLTMVPALDSRLEIGVDTELVVIAKARQRSTTRPPPPPV
jgi:hypothetical protein